MEDDISTRKFVERDYKTFESESITFVSTIYAMVSLFLVGIYFRFFISQNFELLIVSVYVVIALAFLAFLGVQSSRRTKLNKLPSADILELCNLVKENTTNVDSGSWHVTPDAFNKHAMERLFTRSVAELIPANDYLTYMLAEKYIEVSSVTDKSKYNAENNISIAITDKANYRLKIYENAKDW
ncbi:hypothetical protein ACTNNG_004562 [Vibrio parahaemolyticus]|nr:hypothetical protein [Vibrio parahaemolyticus]ELA8147305.1 hypothetical protein [Vibrio parahaemolyticus]ELA8182314.1 hypothetical protein [Vibrio parahaemolyticus]ELB2732981.1 hypothetical protein [Vibrio parahaemolyticus]